MAKAPPIATGRLTLLRLFSTLLAITLINGPCRLHAAHAALHRKEGKSCRLLRSKLLKLRLQTDSNPIAPTKSLIFNSLRPFCRPVIPIAYTLFSIAYGRVVSFGDPITKTLSTLCLLLTWCSRFGYD